LKENGGEFKTDKLEHQKQGRPLLVGKTIDELTQKYLYALRDAKQEVWYCV